jgi:hypothetical protein
MFVPLANPNADPTLDALREVLAKSDDKPRHYLGASEIGDKCERKLWYSLNMPELARPMELRGRLATGDGHRAEAWMAEQLAKLPFIQIEVTQPDGMQFGFIDMENKFKGHADGFITGLLQAPATRHVWEHKCVNEKKFELFKKAKADYGEKGALEKWDYLYYAQAVTYMEYFGCTRHYLTVTTPGCRDFDSARTNEDKVLASALRSKARRIIDYASPPYGISTNPNWFECKFCNFREVCHNL